MASYNAGFTTANPDPAYDALFCVTYRVIFGIAMANFMYLMSVHMLNVPVNFIPVVNWHWASHLVSSLGWLDANWLESYALTDPEVNSLLNSFSLNILLTY